MTDLSISPQDYIEKFGTKFVCETSRKWLLENDFQTMEDAVAKCHRGDWMLMLAIKIPFLTHKQIVRVALFSARLVEHLVPDPAIKECNDTLERWIAGEATNEDVMAARSAIYDVIESDAVDYARAATLAATRAAVDVSSVPNAAVAHDVATDVAAYSAGAETLQKISDEIRRIMKESK